MNLKDKVVVITGSSSGIGKEVSKMLAQKGAKLALLSRRLPEMEQLVKDYKALNTEAIAIKTDVTSAGDIKHAVEETMKKFGKIDVVINCAGIGNYSPLETLDMKTFEHMLRVNIFGPLYMIQETVKHLKATKGMIVNISSGLSKRALPFLSAYGSTKAMLNMLSDGLRMELMSSGVQVLTYNPPATDTPFIALSNRGSMKLAKVEDVAAQIVKSMEQEKREVSASGFLAVMNFFAPKVLDSMFYRNMVKRVEDNKQITR
jgi:short-subunit dehydrogenase